MKEEPVFLTAWNDGMFNPVQLSVQLSVWHADVDMQYIVSCRRVIEYYTKCITKSEPSLA